MKYHILTFAVICSLFGSNHAVESSGVFGKLRSGFEITRKLLGLDRAKGVAQLVSDAFGSTHRKGDTVETGNNIFSSFLRVLGLDSKKISAIAVNAIIFVAQLISSSLSNIQHPHIGQTRSIRNGTPFDWMLNNTRVNFLFDHVKDRELPNHIIEYIKERSLDEETDCVQLLVCKSAPFIWGMQKALKLKMKKRAVKGSDALFKHLPKLEEVTEHGDRCELKHPYCVMHV